MRRRTGVVAGVAALALGAAGGAALAQEQAGGGGGRPVFGVLSGANEIGPDGRPGAGDPDGRGSATALFDDGQLCFGLTVRNIGEPVGAHIHRGRRGENGPVVVPLTAPSTGDPGASSGCVAVEPTLAREIRRHPRRFYFNVHTREYPGGAVRGQVAVRRRR